MVSQSPAGRFARAPLAAVFRRLPVCFLRAVRGPSGFFPVLFCIIAISSVAYAAPGACTSAHPRRDGLVLLRPKLHLDPAALERFHSAQRSQVLRRVEQVNDLQVVRIPAGKSVEGVIEQYQRSGLVEYAEPDYQVQAALAPNDPAFASGALWGLNNIGQSPGVPGADIKAPQAWNTQTLASGIVVAVIDSGVRYTHEDLAANMWVNPHDGSHGFNALTGSNDPMDDYGHGTLVAGIIGGVGNNGTGISGVAWRVQLMACKFLDAKGNGFVSDAIECIEYARTNGAHIINASWGSPANSAALADAIASAGRAGIVFVAAAGNNGTNIEAAPFYPASFDLDNVVAVAATTQSDTLAGFSNYGAGSVDLAAPGNAVYSTYHSSDSAYAYSSGTSIAAPFVSGAFALMRARYVSLTCDELIGRLLAAADPLPGLAGKCASGGRLNLANALCPPVLAEFTATPTTGAVPLTVHFTDASQGVIANRVWDFGDGALATNALNPTHFFTPEGSFTVTLTVTSDRGIQSRATQTIQAVPNYTILPASFQWLNTDLAIPITLNSNGVSPAINLPFPFVFYGKSYLQVTLGANGVVAFGNQGLPLPVCADLPDTNSPHAILCPFWTDLNAAPASSLWLGVRGKPPLRRVVITWAGATGSLNFQAVLLESSQRILFQYLTSADGPLDRFTSQSAIVGIAHESGRVAARYSNNGSATLTNRQAIAFVPASKNGVTNFPVATIKAMLPTAAGQFQLQLAGQPAGTCIVEASADLSHWIPVGSGISGLDGLFGFCDLQSTSLPQRFYRARFEP